MYQLTIIVIVTMYIFSTVLKLLNYQNRNKPVPSNVADVYNKKEYLEWKNYEMDTFRLNMISQTVEVVLLLTCVFTGLFPKIASLTSNLTGDNRLNQLLFVGVVFGLKFIVDTIFSSYRTFHIEEAYGFNKATVKTFIFDQIKTIVLISLIAGGLLYFIMFVFESFGVKSMFIVWITLGILLVAINLLYVKVFVKLFNKMSPLEEGELYDKATALANSLGFEIKNISVIDASKRSTKVNAFFSGFGKYKSIILYDNLIERFTTDEIISILAHELGHAEYKDTLRNSLTTMVQFGIFLLLLGYLLTSSSFANAFGFDQIHLGFSVVLFLVLIEPIGTLLSVPVTYLSRVAEYRADKFAAAAGYSKPMITALKRLAKENFVNLTPHPLMVAFFHSHPTINQRVSALELSN